MAFGFKLPATGSANQETGTATSGVKTPLPAFLAKQSAIQQMKTLGAIFLLLLLLIAALVYHDNRESTHGTAYVSAAGEMRMLSQRLAKASTLALQGKANAFAQLKESRDTFAQLLERVSNGGDIAGTYVPASPEGVKPQIEALTQRWLATEKDAEAVITQEKNLISLGKNVETIDSKNGALLELTEQVAALKLQSGSASTRYCGG
jgi:twitching motility protein PilJ